MGSIGSVTLKEYIVLDIKKLLGNVYKILMTSRDGQLLHYSAGQYLQILFPDGSFQPFSIANSPVNTSDIELHIRCLSEDNMSNEFIASVIKTKSIKVIGPFGKASYDDLLNKPTLMLAAGTGFAPVKSIIETMIANHDDRYVYLYWGVRHIEDFYLPDLPKIWLTQLQQFRYTPVISQPTSNASWKGKTGWLHEAVMSDYTDLDNYQVYACGPYAMVLNALDAFLKLGLKRERFFSDVLN